MAPQAGPPIDPPVSSPDASAEARPVPPMRAVRQGFAEEQGPNVVLVMGVVLFVLACASFFADHLTIAVLFALSAVVAVVMATGLARLQVLKLEILKLVVFFAKFRDDK